MAISSSLGIGSGMDINGIVSQLVAAEGQPQFNAIGRQETAAKAQVSGLGSLKSALSTFQTAVRKLNDVNLFKTNQAVSGNEGIVKITAGAGSVAGSHTVQVTNLAKAQKSVAVTEFTGASEVVGSGTMTFAVGDTPPFSLTIDSSNNTLAGIRDAINGASDNNGVTASIINVNNSTNTGTISKLVLTAKDTGLANAFSVAVVGDAGLARLDSSTPANFTGEAAKDANILVDGQAVTRSSNVISDVLQGVTLDLQSAVPGTDVNVDIKLDNEAIKKTITDFVAAYNTMTSTAEKLGKFAGKDGGSNGALLGDSTLRNIRNDLRQQTSVPVTSANAAFNTLKSIGIDIDKSGVMTMDGSKLDKALATNLSSVSDVFSSSDGVATRLNAKVIQYLQTGGALDTRQTSLNKQLKQLSDKRDSVQLRLDNVQKGLMKQFIAMDIAVGRFQSTGSFLSNQINQWS
ncbi:flagellar filament capping protein FliD [Methylobacter sp. G7]|uniref:flagellar filament capping protein FliD n=1 Tax=Methylobacter sp. G7 TaxID=3230117 RepID=UPI003D803035